MNRKLFVTLIFAVVFGLPVVWYLFLQMFGSNEFDLPVIDGVEVNCLENKQRASLLIDSLGIIELPNQKRRLMNKFENIESVDLLFINADSCFNTFQGFLLDKDNQIRGTYELSREEVDRMLTEIDIYIKNTSSN